MLGELELPQHALYGIATARALENYQITGIPLHHFPELIIGLAYVKKASARANFRLGLLDANVARAIEQACDDLISSKQVRPDGAFPNQAARGLMSCMAYIYQYWYMLPGVQLRKSYH